MTREFREYERASATVLAAYVQPVIDRYLKEFARELDARSFTGRFSLMQSNGGRLPASGMAGNAITALFSGPAAGVMGAIRQAERSGFRDLVTLDMGGTSTDVCLVRDGVPTLTTDAEIDGLPIRTPVLDIVTVGAGGGSIVWRDDGGMLRVGPRSAGADPGPACYRRGGTDPTITDAHLVRGTVLADTFLGGRMEVDAALARESFGALSERLGRDVEQIADDALRVAEHNIVRAIQLVSTERGRDPRDYVLVPFGGAGPLHAARVAEVLSMDTIVIPPAAGVLSAFGLVASDFVRYESRTERFPIDEAGAADRVRDRFAEMRAGAEAAFAELGIAGALRFTHTLEMRYVGQAFEVPVTLGEDEIAGLDAAFLRTRFNAAHHRIFEFDDSRTNRPEVVSFRLGIASPPPSVPELAATQGEPLSDNVTIFDAGAHRTARRVNRRALLRTGESEGPLLIGDDTSTAYVPPGWSARTDAHHNVVLRSTDSSGRLHGSVRPEDAGHD